MNRACIYYVLEEVGDDEVRTTRRLAPSKYLPKARLGQVTRFMMHFNTNVNVVPSEFSEADDFARAQTNFLRMVYGLL